MREKMEIGIWAIVIIACAILASIGTLYDFSPALTGLAVYDEDGSHAFMPLGSIRQSIIDAVMSSAIRPGNEPYFIERGNKTAVLALHGLTASPWEMLEAAEFLAERNISVYAPLLAGHGTTPDNLRKTSWQDWYFSAENALSLLEKHSENIYILGVSTGSDIAVVLAKNHPNVKGIILASPAVRFRDWKARYAWLFKYFIKYVETSKLTEEERFYYYDVKPVASVDQLGKLAKEVKAALPGIRMPVLVMQSLEDPTVDPEGAEYLFENIASGEKEIIWFEKGGHVIVRDPVIKLAVFNDALEFIEKNEK